MTNMIQSDFNPVFTCDMSLCLLQIYKISGDYPSFVGDFIV